MRRQVRGEKKNSRYLELKEKNGTRFYDNDNFGEFFAFTSTLRSRKFNFLIAFLLISILAHGEFFRSPPLTDAVTKATTIITERAGDRTRGRMEGNQRESEISNE
jgi:hypothetical protein